MSGSRPPKYFTDFATKVEAFMEQQLAFNEKIWNEIQDIKSCPTIKKELAQVQNERS